MVVDQLKILRNPGPHDEARTNYRLIIIQFSDLFLSTISTSSVWNTSKPKITGRKQYSGRKITATFTDR
jgi:hypothetical protein